VTAAQERFGLGLGELSTLILAKEIGAELLLLDDLRARKLAQQKGAFVQGTVGILELCFRRGYLRDLREAYALLMKRGVYLNREFLNIILESCGLTPL
jgi:hypothetical protein